MRIENDAFGAAGLNHGETMNQSTFRLDSAPEAYLRATPLVDFDHPAIQRYVALWPSGRSPEEVARAAFHFVRDEVDHSWDIQSRRVTACASEVLEHREGICYAKSHLLAALLRAQGLPAGICYQRLTLLDDPSDGYCIHALNAVYLADEERWVRMDARGNKPGVDAQFSLEEERLAFAVRPTYGERDYGVVHAEPHPRIVATLQGNSDCLVMYARHLPTDLDDALKDESG